MEKTKIPTGEMLLTEQLPNGLLIAMLPKPGFHKKYAVLSTKYGSLDSRFSPPDEEEMEVPAGIAHFLEHKLFEEEEEGNSFDRFAELGASVNAFTSYTQTSYLFSTVDHFQKALNELIRFVMNPYLTNENVEKEKGIIEQELLMYQDHPDRRLHTNILNALYHVNPVKIDIGGTVESVREITVDLLMKCYNTFYQPANMALFVIGDIDPEETLDTVRAHFPADRDGTSEIKRFYPQEPLSVNNPWSEDHLRISRPRYAIGFKNEVLTNGEEMLKKQITMGIVWRLILARSSGIYEELYDTGLIDPSFGASFNGAPQYAYAIAAGQTDDPKKLDQKLRDAIVKMQQEAISATDVERLKRQIYGGHIAAFESLEYVANTYIAHYFNGTPFHKYLSVLQGITVADVQDTLSDALNLEQASVSILWPNA